MPKATCGCLAATTRIHSTTYGNSVPQPINGLGSVARMEAAVRRRTEHSASILPAVCRARVLQALSGRATPVIFGYLVDWVWTRPARAGFSMTSGDLIRPPPIGFG